MKHCSMRFVKALLPCLILCLLAGCGGRAEKQSSPKRVRRTVPLRYEKREPIVGNEEKEAEYLSPINKYTFVYTDSLFPSRTRTHPLLAGFDTDGEGRLYIAGGTPVRLVCYNGEEKEYDIVISEAITNDAIMALVGDSVLLVEENLRSLAKIHKDGLGEVKHYPLPIEPKDSITYGYIDDDTIRLGLFDTSVEYHNYEERIRNEHCCCISISSFEMTPSASSLWPRPRYDGRLIPTAEESLPGFCVYGAYRSLILYYRHDIEEVSKASVALVDCDGNLKAVASLKDVPHSPTIASSHEIEGGFPSVNLYRLKGDHFFMSAFEFDDETISVLEYDLKPLYDSVCD